MWPSPWRRAAGSVMGRLQQRSWTAEDGSARSTVEVGSSLRWATATPVQATKTFSERR